MSVVEVAINGRTYQVVCDDGQEQHLLELARELDGRVGELARSMGQVGDARLILMAGLLIADELSEAREQVATLKQSADAAIQSASDQAADALARVALRIESVAGKLDRG